MKIPNIFVPEKDLTSIVNNYLKNDVNLENQHTHIDPNLNYMISILGVLLRLEGKRSQDTQRIIQKSLKHSEEKKCVYIIDFFKIAEVDLPEDVSNAILEHLKKEYTLKIKMDIVNSYLDDKPVIQNSVVDYVNMVIGIGDEHRQGNLWMYKDPRTGLPKTIVIDLNYIRSVEEQLGLTKSAQKEEYRKAMLKIYATKIQNNPYYDFMDNLELVEAVTNVKLKSEVAQAGSLIGTLASRTDEENKQVYDRVINNMIKHHGYCNVCAEKTLEHFCTYKES